MKMADGDMKAAWREQVTELQRELQMATARMLSDTEQPPSRCCHWLVASFELCLTCSSTTEQKQGHCQRRTFCAGLPAPLLRPAPLAWLAPAGSSLLRVNLMHQVGCCCCKCYAVLAPSNAASSCTATQ